MKQAVLWQGAIGIRKLHHEGEIGIRRQRFDVLDEVAADIVVAEIEGCFHASPPGANAESNKVLASLNVSRWGFMLCDCAMVFSSGAAGQACSGP